MKISKIFNRLFSALYFYHELGVFHQSTLHRVKMLKLALSYVRDERVKGDYLEFGVARGLTFISAYYLNQKLNSSIKNFYAFDSFKGFPEPKGVDKVFERFKKGKEHWPIEEFQKNLKRKKVDLEKVQIIEGFFEEVLTEQLQNKFKKEAVKAAVVWIDCDLYQSAKEALIFAQPFLQQGTVVIFDDWLCYRGDPEKGEQRATKEFLEDYPNIALVPYKDFGVVGKSFIVSKKSK